MRRSWHPSARAWIAAFTATTLLLQALLLSLTPSGTNAAAAIEDLAATTLCFGSGTARENPAAPRPAHDHHSDHACCILCAVPGLAAGAAPPAFVRPVWVGSFLAAAARGRAIHLAQPFERSPVRPRAPPA